MKALWWISFAVVAYTYAGYPLLIAALARLRARPWKREPRPLSVSVVMAVHNGAALLPWKLDHLLSLEPEYVRQIVIVSDGSTDGTAEILHNAADPRVRTLILSEQVGKAAALNQAVAIATSEVLLFVDIRPRIEPGSIAALVSNFADPRVGCVAGELLVQTSDTQDAAAANVGGLYWRYEQAMRNAEAAFDSPVGVYGGFYAARRHLVKAAPAGLILDDMFQPLSIIRQGYRSVVDRKAIVVDVWPATTEAEFGRKVRTLAGNFQLLQCAPWILSAENRVLFQLVSHKLLRLVVPWLMLAMLVSAAVLAGHSVGWALIALAQFALVALAISGALGNGTGVVARLASPLGALLVLNAAAVVGLYRFLFTPGPLWKIWNATALPTQKSYLKRGGTSA